MPRKIRLYVPKGASRKLKDEGPSESSYVTSVETQTDDHDLTSIETNSVSTQTDSPLVIEFKDAAIQTDDDSLQSAHADDNDCDELDESIMCQGNNDEKFIPLIVKHKGVFRDITG